MKQSATDEAIEELYRIYSDEVFRFSLYLSGNWAQAQDLTSEAFIRAWTSTAPMKVSTAKAYLFVIVRNLYLDSVRSKRYTDHAPLENMAEPAAGVDTSAAMEQREELEQTLADLKLIPPGDRAALAMAVFQEMNYEDVAQALEISVGSVKSRIFRARLRLHELRAQRTQRRQKT